MKKVFPPLIELVRTGTPGQVRQAIKDGAVIEERDSDGATPLMWAVSVSSTDKVRELLSAGAKIDARSKHGSTALLCWAMRQWRHDDHDGLAILPLLLGAGARVDETDTEGRTALTCMAYAVRTADEVKAVISAGADVNHKDRNGRTPLMVLVSREYTHAWDDEILRALLDAGAKIDEQDAKGMTALMWAAKKNRESKLVGLLLSNGADGYAKSKAGRTAFDYAYRNPKLEDSAYFSLKEIVRPSPSPDDPASLERARRQDRPLRVCLLLVPLVVNLGAGIWFMSILWAPPRGFWPCLAAVALLIGLNLNPFRLVVLLVRDRFPPRNPKVSLLSDWFLSDDCWGQVLWQTAVLLFLASLAVVNIPVIPAVTERWFGLVCMAELIAIGIFVYLKRRLFRSIGERIIRAISW